MTIAGRIVFLRGRLGLSQKAFAELIGKSAGYMNRIENGKAELTTQLLSAISSTFGVPVAWLESGAGSLTVESIGDRIRKVRKARDYTQEELSQELHISRNSVGMMERGTIRPSEESLSLLCDCLWINKAWLMTGKGSMDRAELTPFYELLKNDWEVRAHIRSFIDHLDRPAHRRETEEKETEETVMVPARVNDLEAARCGSCCCAVCKS